MVNKCDVLIWDKKIGELAYNENMRLIFTYIDTKIPFEISPLHLNTQNRTYDYTLLEQQKGLAGVFADTLPDHYGENVMKRYFDQLGEEANTIDRLLLIGDKTMGAITYEPVQDDIKAKQESMTLGNLYQEAKQLDKKDYFVDLSVSINMLKSVSPIGGAKPKAVIGFKDFDSEIFIGSKNIDLPQDYKYAIVKFNTDTDGSDKDDLKVEHLYMNLAKEADIVTPNTYLSQEGHYVIERFDRKQKGKLHMHTLQGYMHSDFKTPRTVDYLNVFISMQDLQVPQKDIEQMYRRMVFNFMFRNHDDHAKNHSFLMDRNGNWRLSPAYDLTYCYKEGGQYVGDHQLTFNRKLGNDVKFADFKEIAQRFNIKNYKEIIEQVKSLREDKLLQRLKNYDVSKDRINEIINAVKERDIKLPLAKKVVRTKNKKDKKPQER